MHFSRAGLLGCLFVRPTGPMNRVYSFGYSNADIADLAALAREGAMVVDIRYSPTSRLREWRQPALQRTLGAAYRHERRLGNRGYRDGRVAIVDLEGGATAVAQLARRQPVVLLCACSDVDRCHRKAIADFLLERYPGLEVVHLGQKERRCRCGRFLDPGESECPFCAPPLRQPTLEEWVVLGPSAPVVIRPQEDIAARLTLPGGTSSEPLDTSDPEIDAAVARYSLGLEQLARQLGWPVPWKWQAPVPLTVSEAEALLQDAAKDLGLAPPAMQSIGEVADAGPAGEVWPVDLPFPEDEAEPEFSVDAPLSNDDVADEWEE